MLKYFDVKLSETLLWPFCVPVKVTRLHRLNLHLKAIPLRGWNHRPMTSTVSFTSKRPGANCSKLTTLLVNVSLKFKTSILQKRCYFCWKNVRIFCSAKNSYIFPTIKNSVFDNVVSIYLISKRINDVVRLHKSLRV